MKEPQQPDPPPAQPSPPAKGVGPAANRGDTEDIADRHAATIPPKSPQAATDSQGGKSSAATSDSEPIVHQAVTVPPKHRIEDETPLASDAIAIGAELQSPTIASDHARRFGDYELLHEIARGGMGVVYKARQIRLNRIVAIKMILAGQFASKADVHRFYTEAAAAANLKHPNIVAIYEIGECDGQHFFSMEYVEGSNLSALVRDSPLPPRDAAWYAQAIADAIQFAHQHGILHRDLKPSNVLIQREDAAIVQEQRSSSSSL